MSNPKEKCPYCGNWVEGKANRSFANKATRVGAKTLVGGALPAIGMATGGPLGAAAGFAVGTMVKTGIGLAVDKVADAMEGGLDLTEYEFTCPNCGHVWSPTSDQSDNEVDSELDFFIDEVKSQGGLVVVKGDLFSGSIYQGMHVCIQKDDGKLIPAVVEEIFCEDEDLTVSNVLGHFGLMGYEKKYESTTYIDTDGENLGVLLHLSGVRANQVKPRDTIVDDYEEYDDEEEVSYSSISSISSIEQDYLNEVKECLADGEIGPRERRLLEKIREKSGISPQRAAELEVALSVPQLTDNEKEYLTEFKECAINGVVSDKERRLLEKMRKMYGITEARAKELERM